jgi:alpha-L-arabinofuranosidase
MAIRRFVTGRSMMSLFGLVFAALGASSTPAEAQLKTDSAALSVSPARLAFYANQDGSTPTQSLFSVVTIANHTPEPLNWTVVPSDPWITFDRRQGSVDGGSTATVAVAVDIAQGRPGAQQGTVILYDAATAESLATVPVFLRVCQGTCVSVDAAAIGHTISPLLFGSQTDWLSSGNYLWNRAPSATCNSASQLGGAPIAGAIDLARSLGVRLLRYPGGITADFFNWSESVGPVPQRTPQLNPYASASFWQVRECPVFGPDEFMSVASQLQAQALIVANVGSGSGRGAANWLTYNLQRGIHPQYWEIGNENYLSGVPVGDPNGYPYAFAAAYQYPDQYALKFADYARALRAVDPTVKVGAVVDPDDSSWNRAMLPRLAEPVDFVATHLLFPKWSCNLFTPDEQIYRTLLAAPLLMTYQLERLKQTIAAAAVGANKDARIAITEYGTFFWCFDNARNHSLASALYTAMNLHVFFRDPRIVIATQSNLVNPSFQAPIGITRSGSAMRDALYEVLRPYTQAAGGQMTATSVVGSPTFSSDGIEGFPSLPAVPALDTVAVTGPEAGTVRLFVVNRSLSSDIVAHVAFDSFAGSVGSVTAVVVNAASYTSENTETDQNAVTTTTAPAAAATEFDMSFPAHSLVVFVVKRAE